VELLIDVRNHDVSTSKSQPPKYSARVEYVQPSSDELKKQFDSMDAQYEDVKFEVIEHCKGVSKENHGSAELAEVEITFEYVHMGRDASPDEVLIEMGRKELRPALYEELLGFAKKYPDEHRKFPIAALGSLANVYGERVVAYVWRDIYGQHLGLGWFDSEWSDSVRFLAVSKAGSAIRK
jgi:hypothetical protein